MAIENVNINVINTDAIKDLKFLSEFSIIAKNSTPLNFQTIDSPQRQLKAILKIMSRPQKLAILTVSV